MFEGAAMVGKVLARSPFRRHARALNVPDLMDPDLAGRGQVTTVMKSVNSLGRARSFLEALPDLRVIHILRHPCGVIASQLRGEAEGHIARDAAYLAALFVLPSTSSYGVELDAIMSASYEEQLAFQWMVCNDLILNETKGNPRYTHVVYEDLCRNTHQHMTELLAFAELDPDPQVSDFIGQLEGESSADPAYFSVMRSPRESIGKWRTELGNDQIDRILKVVEGSGAYSLCKG